MGIRVKGEPTPTKVNNTDFLDIQMEKVGTPNSANDTPKPEDKPDAPSKT